MTGERVEFSRSKKSFNGSPAAIWIASSRELVVIGDVPKDNGSVFKSVTSLHKRIAEELEAVGGKIHLVSPTDRPILDYVRTQLNQLASDSPKYFRQPAKLTSGEIAGDIRGAWDSLRRAPWSEDIKSSLALLKYHVENGETARFWVCEYRDHYGFRLRTRDHSWLVGEIWVNSHRPATAPESNDLVVICQGSHASSQTIAKGGFFVLSVKEERESEY